MNGDISVLNQECLMGLEWHLAIGSLLESGGDSEAWAENAPAFPARPPSMAARSEGSYMGEASVYKAQLCAQLNDTQLC